MNMIYIVLDFAALGLYEFTIGIECWHIYGAIIFT